MPKKSKHTNTNVYEGGEDNAKKYEGGEDLFVTCKYAVLDGGNMEQSFRRLYEMTMSCRRGFHEMMPQKEK